MQSVIFLPVQYFELYVECLGHKWIFSELESGVPVERNKKVSEIVTELLRHCFLYFYNNPVGQK